MIPLMTLEMLEGMRETARKHLSEITASHHEYDVMKDLAEMSDDYLASLVGKPAYRATGCSRINGDGHTVSRLRCDEDDLQWARLCKNFRRQFAGYWLVEKTAQKMVLRDR